MYTTFLWLHSWWRWVVLLALVAAVVAAWLAWRVPARRSAAVAKLASFAVGALDLQMLLGLWLFFGASPFTRAAMADPGAAMRNSQLRFWLVEHGPVMVVAIALAHIGKVAAKRAPDEKGRYKRLAILLTLSLVVLLAAVPWPGTPAGRPLFR